jgi:carboxypeptidase A
LKKGNRAIFIESNIHAREWITAATTTWMINELLRSTNAEAMDLASNIDWYFIPVLNPDGYEYTRHHNRNWRKTRSVQTPLCSGVDGNRNFAFNWMVPDENGNTGTSSSSCNDIFPGYTPFSEVETAALDQYLRKHHGKFDAYIAVTTHNY